MSALSYRNFAARYANIDATDVFCGDDASVLSKFSSCVGRKSNTTSSKILEKVFLTACVQPHAYLCLLFAGKSLADAVITVLHTPFRVTPPMGTSKKALNLFFLGEVAHEQPPMVIQAPDDGFSATGLIRVPDSAVLDSAFEDTDTMFVGPYKDTNAGTTVATARYMMHLPSKFLPLAFSQPSFSPPKAWEILGNAIRQDALADDATTTLDQYAPILTWLCVACTRLINSDGEEDLANALREMEVPTPPFTLTPAITAAAQEVFCRDLPGLTKESAPTVLESTVQAINQLMD